MGQSKSKQTHNSTQSSKTSGNTLPTTILNAPRRLFALQSKRNGKELVKHLELNDEKQFEQHRV